MMPRDQFHLARGAQLVVRALHQMDIPAASMSARHDVVVDGRKVSGSAYRLVAKRAFHHGTMLIDSDLTALRHVLEQRTVVCGVR